MAAILSRPQCVKLATGETALAPYIDALVQDKTPVR